MKLRAYHCTEFSLRLKTDRGNFAHEKFFEDPRIADEAASWESGEPLNLTSYTRNPRTVDYHVHAHLRLAKGNVVVRIIWVPGVFTGPRDSRPPFAGDFLSWIGRFFKSNAGPATVVASYSFPTSKYRSGVSLPMPLIFPGSSGKPRTILGMTFTAEFRGASRATIDSEIMPDKSIWGMIYASYKKGFQTLSPERLLPEFSKELREVIIKR
jgi:hypothetical protein